MVSHSLPSWYSGSADLTAFICPNSLAATLSRARPSFFTQTDRVCHRTGPAGEIPQLDAAEKTNQALKLPPLP